MLTDAISVSPTESVCPTPATAPGHYSIRLVTSGGASSNAKVSSNALSLVITGDTSVWRVVPSDAPGSGGASVTVTGSHFAPFGVICIFGDVPVNAMTVSTSKITCRTPVHEPARVSFFIEDATRVASIEPVQFLFLDTPRVAFIHPTRGAGFGASYTKVVGAHFQSGLRCRFGTLAADATVITSSEAHCTSPPVASGPVSLEIASRGGGFMHTGVTFLCVPVPETLQVSPSSDVTPGSRVTVSGASFSTAPNLVLRIGHVLQPALDRRTDASATVLLPPGLDSGNFSISASNDGVAFSVPVQVNPNP